MAIARQKAYEYGIISEDEIRLVILAPEGSGGRSSKLRGQLKTYRLTVQKDDPRENILARSPAHQPISIVPPTGGKHEEAPQYEALSYTWGGDDNEMVIGPGQYIHIFDTPNKSALDRSIYSGREIELGHIRLTKNLEEALRTFRAKMRPENATLLLWIDAICIRQKHNHHEKSVQIGRMADIYAEAEQVRVWLGQDNGAFADIHSFIKQILTLNNFDAMVRSTENARKWNAMLNLMQSPWFQRRWIVQEIAFARQATVYWGKSEIPWDEFASAVQLFASKRDILRKMFHQSTEAHYDPDLIGEVEAYGATNLVDRVDKMLRKSKDGDIMELLFSLETILTTMAAFNVAKPHDTVYAIVQLSKDARPTSDATLRQDSGSSHKSQATDVSQADKFQFVLSEVGRFSSQSPQRSDEIVEKAVNIALMNAGLEDGLSEVVSRGRSPMTAAEARGRSPNRRAHKGTHLNVRDDASGGRSRSRGRSPAAAKQIAERAYRQRRKKFVVNYDSSILALCTEVIQFVTDASKSLDIIVKPWAPDVTALDRYSFELDDDKPIYPSWIRSAGERPFAVSRTANGGQKSRRVRADNLAGIQHQSFKTYSASGKVQPERPEDLSLIQDRILNAKGFVLDKIDELQAVAINANIPAGWLASVKWMGSHGSAPPDDFWRTLVANRQFPDRPTVPPLYWRQACQWAFSQYARHGNLDVNELIYNLGNSGTVSEPVVEFLRRVRAVVWDRALIKTEGNPRDGADLEGLLGLVPWQAQKGDLICILHGCSVPVVLRRKERSIRPERNQAPPRPRKRKRPTYDESEGSGTRLISPSSTASEDSYYIVGRDGNQASINTELNKLDLADSENEEYSLIGECYIHGMMDGEAFDYVDRKYDAADGLQQKRLHRTRLFRIGCPIDCNCPRCEPR